MEPQLLEKTLSTCLHTVIGIILGALPLGLLFVCTLRLCTPAFNLIFAQTTGVFILELIGFLSYWGLSGRATNACLVVIISFYFILLFLLGFFLYLDDFSCSLQHGFSSGF